LARQARERIEPLHAPDAECKVRCMSFGPTLTPGYKVIYPHRDSAASQATKLIVVVLLLISVVLMLIVTIGGWSKLQGLKPLNFFWCLVYLAIAFYVWRWRRGMLPIAAALAILLLILALIAGTGIAGTGWFDRDRYGYAAPENIFGGRGLGPDALGLFTLLLVPVQALLILFAMRGFAQGWNVELEVPIDDAGPHGYTPTGPPPPAAAAA
jgi:hypothetical protein